MKKLRKRIFDITISSIIMVLFLPIMAIISSLIFISMGSPVIFRQERPGYKGIPFKMYKFRTMNNQTSLNGKLLSDKDRLTRLGKFLRATSLDELPELLNVLKGDMSLVGPRPLAMEYLSRYNPEQARRHDVKPGITGWAQVKGRNHLSWEERFKLDVWYVDNYNFWFDLKIILLTIKTVILREGVVPEGRSAIQDFMGEKKDLNVNNTKIGI